MIEIQTTKDVLFVVLAFCALWFTIFVCWALYYVIGILRDTSYVMREIHDKIAAIDQAVHAVRHKVETSLGSFGIAAAGLKMLGGYLDRRKEKTGDEMGRAVEKLKKTAKKVRKRIVEELEADTD